MTFDPTQNRVQTYLLTADELATLKAAKHGWEYMVPPDMDWGEIGEPSWVDENIYRAKPAPRPTIICNGVEVPEPVREALAHGTEYYVADVCSSKWRGRCTWSGDEYDIIYLKRGLIHRTEADAVSHAKAMAKAGCV